MSQADIMGCSDSERKMQQQVTMVRELQRIIKRCNEQAVHKEQSASTRNLPDAMWGVQYQ